MVSVVVLVSMGLTVKISVAVLAHWPASGVNVYVVVAVLFNAGAHVPVIPLLDVVGNGAIVVPAHTAATALKVGAWFALTVMVNCAVVAHWPAVGVNV